MPTAITSATLTLDDVIPAPHFAERHERRIAAPPETVWTALHEMRLRDSPAAVALMAVRALPVLVLARRLPAMVDRAFLERGPVPVIAADRPRSVVAGGVMQPWKPSGGETPPRLGAGALRRFAEPGWVKCGVDFVLREDAGGTLLTTETRVLATDRITRRRFGAYWLLIRPGSGLIRREMLRLVARRAEAAAP